MSWFLPLSMPSSTEIVENSLGIHRRVFPWSSCEAGADSKPPKRSTMVLDCHEAIVTYK